MLAQSSPTTRRIVLAALFALTLWFAWSVRTVLNPILLGYLLAYVLHPMVQRLERRGFRRRTAVGVIFCAFALAMLVLSIAVAVQAKHLWADMSQTGGVVDQLDLRLKNGLQQISEWLARYDLLQPTPSTAAANEPVVEDGGQVATISLRDLWAQAASLFSSDVDVSQAGKAGLQAAGGALNYVRGFFGSLLSLATLLFLLPIYTYFLLFELDHIHGFFAKYIPARDRNMVASISRQIGDVLSAFLRGRLLVSLLKGAFIALGLALLGVPYALLLGLAAAFLSLIPVLGPLVAFVLGATLGMLEHEPLGALWRTAAVYSLAEVLEGYVLMPKILGESLGMHPVVVLASLMIGGAALGMFGLLLALPLAASVIILTRELVLPALKKTSQERG